MNDPLGEVHREAYVAPTGHVYLQPEKMLNPFLSLPDTTRLVRDGGSLHIGLYGVTVTQPDGSSWMYPWRVVQAVQMDKPGA